MDADFLLLFSRPTGESCGQNILTSLQVQDSTAEIVQVLSYRKEGCAQVSRNSGKDYQEFTGVLWTYEKAGGKRKTVSEGLLHS